MFQNLWQQYLDVFFLLGMVAAAVFLFITYGMRESHMEHFEKECFETEYGVSGMVREKKDFYEPIFIRGTAVGVVLCILAVIPDNYCRSHGSV